MPVTSTWPPAVGVRQTSCTAASPGRRQVTKLQAAIKYGQEDLAGAKSMVEQCLSDDPDTTINQACLLFKVGALGFSGAGRCAHIIHRFQSNVKRPTVRSEKTGRGYCKSSSKGESLPSASSGSICPLPKCVSSQFLAAA